MIVAFTGAGISKPSGIPTFMEQGDLRDKLERGYATRHPEKFQVIMDGLKATCAQAEPNDAHMALAEYKIPVITMNIDGLHERAGSEIVLPVHGTLEQDNVVLYGDMAPNYSEAIDWVSTLNPNDILLIVGTSFYTLFSSQIKIIAQLHSVRIEIINENAEIEVRKFLEAHKNYIEPFEEIDKRKNILYPYRSF